MLNRTFIPMALLLLVLAADAATQSAAPDSSLKIGPAKPDFFNRVIANQKKGEAALDVYERIERVETRKSPSDPAPAAIKISRVIPSGTGMVRIPLGADSKPAIPPLIAPNSRVWRESWRCSLMTADLNATPWKNMRRKRKKRTS